jgi:murein DD-endopeptidase MepM/ murein hydrolase activator NlpD
MASPVPGKRITTAYKEKGKHWKFGYHTGVDYRCAVGTDICAAADGRVLEVGIVSWGPSYGVSIVVDHGNGLRAIYAHLSKALVKKGQRIKIGQHIGEAGSTGNSTGPHLHFEVRVAPFRYAPQCFVDPAVLIGKKAGA